ncbi:MAG: DUF1610 domain-containing protein [Nanoarchaeota archaeon]|nr:DUF1610 domain-containing protein [Nanoarchaeota archaeon]MCG2719064.1 zinc finger domain-containing protein [Nanoarchaeota archaeon]
MKKLTCNSCKKEITNDLGATQFKCPECGKAEIVRCKNCREIGARYKCSACGFEGPN